MDELDLRVRNHAYVSFVRNGIVPTPADAAAELGIAEAEATAAYRRLHDAHALVLEPDSLRIRMLNPFSAVETPHRVECAGRSWFANCAWDALGIPAALHADAGIEAPLGDGESIRFTIEAGRLQGWHGVVHFPLPFRRWYDDLIET